MVQFSVIIAVILGFVWLKEKGNIKRYTFASIGSILIAVGAILIAFMDKILNIQI
jgi:glucose uptake protein GlcU